MPRIFWITVAVLVLGSVAGWAQAPPPVPVPIPGGDVIPNPDGSSSLWNQFLPGPGFDGLNADPHGLTNFRGLVAMGYTFGLATDNKGNTYQVITDIRVYQGDYIGAQATYGGGGTTSAKGHGTFVEI
jgi:hypothetical protein